MKKFVILLPILLPLLFNCSGTKKVELADKNEHSPSLPKDVKHRPRVAQGHLTYDQGGFCQKNFAQHVQQNVRLPKQSDPTFNTYLVPLLFHIKEDGSLHSLAVEANYTNTPPEASLTQEFPFEAEALALLQSSGPWIPFSYEGKYVDREASVVVRFRYHPLYFAKAKPGDEIYLNPDTKAVFVGDSGIFKTYTHPQNGFEGSASFLVIIEKDGSMTNEICLETAGRTNGGLALSYLKKLVPWKAAVARGNRVRSQMEITIFTQ